MLQMKEHKEENELVLTELEEKNHEDTRWGNCEKLGPRRFYKSVYIGAPLS